MYICICKAVTDTQIRQEVQRGAHTLREVCQNLGAGTQCGRCAQQVLSEMRAALPPIVPAHALTTR